MKYVDRCYMATVHKGHRPLHIWLDKLAELYEDGKVEYACVALETTATGRVHLQPFLVFNESAWTLKEGNKTKTFKPTELFGEGSGDYRKARSLSGARDYAARRGIHIGKPGLIEAFEFGDWVDPAYNAGLRTRLSFEFAYRIAGGENIVSLALENPSGVLVVGQKQLEDLSQLRGGVAAGITTKRPYYYIGRSELNSYLNLEQFYEVFQDEEE